MASLRQIAFAALIAATGCAHVARPAATTPAVPDQGRRAPVVDQGWRGPAADLGHRIVAPRGAVASANALASEAGVEILRAGGNAVDAAVATAFAIGVVEPQMSGLGGGGAAVVWMANERKAYDLDFYAAQYAPEFEGNTDVPGSPDLRVVGLPGDVAGLLELQQRFGRLSRERVMAPAIRLAENGFPIGQILARMIAADSTKLRRSPEAWARFWPDGRPLPAGAWMRNPDLAASLRAVAAGGRDAFYAGRIAEDLVATLNAGGHPARAADLARFRTRWLRPLCADYRGHVLLSAAPPQTGLQVLHTLELLEPFDLRALGLPTRSAEAFDVLASALRVGMADARVNDDPDWAPVPAAGVVSSAYAVARESLVGTGHPTDSIRPGDPTAFDTLPAAPSCRAFQPYGAAHPVVAAPTNSPAVDGGNQGGETTHMSVIDAEGNAVALTQTNSSVFGSGAWVDGFFLNDSGFRFTDRILAMPHLSPWRTRISTIAPTLVLDADSVRMVIGAPGGGRIPTEIVQVMVYILDYGLDPLDAVLMPRIFPSRSSRQVQLEHGFPPALLHAVREQGYEVVPPSPEYARLYVIVRGPDGWIAVSDPRHDGEPRGY